MSRRRTVDSSKLIEAVKSGRVSKATLDSFGLDTAVRTDKEKAGKRVRRPRVAVEVEIFRDIQVNKRGSIILPKSLIEELGFALEDSFAIRKTKAGISLRKL